MKISERIAQIARHGGSETGKSEARARKTVRSPPRLFGASANQVKLSATSLVYVLVCHQGVGEEPAARFRPPIGPTPARPPDRPCGQFPNCALPSVFCAAPQDRRRCLTLAAQLATLQSDLKARRVPRAIDIPSQAERSGLPLLPEMERTVALISQAFSSSERTPFAAIPALVEEEHPRFFVGDAFLRTLPTSDSPLRGGLASLAAYIIYTDRMARPSTALATCIITALSTIGASRQKQVLRLAGALIGGVVFGMGTQVFGLPISTPSSVLRFYSPS